MGIIFKKILYHSLAAVGVAVPYLAFAQFDPNRAIGASGLPDTPLYLVLVSVMRYLLLIFTVVAVIGFLVSGLIFITAGASGRADIGQKWLIFTIVGIIVGLIGYIVIRLIDNLLRGVVAV